MNRVRRYLDRRGTSMFFAVILFLVMTVLGINLLNAAYANTANVQRKIENQQVLFYLSSAFEVVNKMIVEGEFYDTVNNKMPEKAESVWKTKGETMKVSLAFEGKAGSLVAKMQFIYEGKTYHITSYYKRQGANGKYILERCKGIQEL